METHPPQVGDPAPDFELVSDSAKKVRLSDFRGRRVILYFYPKDGSPGCTAQACGFRDAHAQLRAHNTVVIGVSPDSVRAHQAFKARHKLPFILLADEDHAVAAAYGVWGRKTRFGITRLGVIRSHFVIDPAGRVAEVHFKVSPRESVARALGSIRA